MANKLPGATTIAALPYGIFTASASFTYQPAGIQEPPPSLPATCNLHVPVGGVPESPLAAMHCGDALAIVGIRRGVRVQTWRQDVTGEADALRERGPNIVVSDLAGPLDAAGGKAAR